MQLRNNLLLLLPHADKNMQNKVEKNCVVHGDPFKECFAWYCLFVLSTAEEICTLYFLYKYKIICRVSWGRHLGTNLMWWLGGSGDSVPAQRFSSEPNALWHKHHKSCWLCLWGPNQAYSPIDHEKKKLPWALILQKPALRSMGSVCSHTR